MSVEAEAETKPIVGVAVEESMDAEVEKAWEETTIGKWGLRLVNLVLVVFGGAVLALVAVSIFSGQYLFCDQSQRRSACLLALPRKRAADILQPPSFAVDLRC